MQSMLPGAACAVLCGNNGDACWAKYGSYPLHRPYCHEMALRIVLASMQQHASRHKRYIVPVRTRVPPSRHECVATARLRSSYSNVCSLHRPNGYYVIQAQFISLQ